MNDDLSKLLAETDDLLNLINQEKVKQTTKNVASLLKQQLDSYLNRYGKTPDTNKAQPSSPTTPQIDELHDWSQPLPVSCLKAPFKKKDLIDLKEKGFFGTKKLECTINCAAIKGQNIFIFVLKRAGKIIVTIPLSKWNLEVYDKILKFSWYSKDYELQDETSVDANDWLEMKNKHGGSDSRKNLRAPTSVAPTSVTPTTPRPLSDASFGSYDDVEEKQQVPNGEITYDDIENTVPVVNKGFDKFENRNINIHLPNTLKTYPAPQDEYLDPVTISEESYNSIIDTKKNEDEDFYDDVSENPQTIAPKQMYSKQHMIYLPKQENYFLCLYETNSLNNEYILKLNRGDIIELIEEVSNSCFLGKYNSKLGLVPHKNVIAVYECITSLS